MAKRRRRRVKEIPLTIGQDPSLWRFGSVHEALEANTQVLSELIRAGQSADLDEDAALDERDSDNGSNELAAR